MEEIFNRSAISTNETENYDKNPFIVIRKVTRACALKCLHCRAEAQYQADPRQLSFEEGKKLIVTKQVIDHAKELGLLRWVFSLDGSTAEIHDHFRGTKGSYAVTGDYLESDLYCAYVPKEFSKKSATK